MALIGTNGSGKTTTLSLLAGLLQPNQGQVLIHGIDIHTHPLLAKPYIGFLPDHPPLYPELTVRENLEHSAKLRQVPNETIQTTIDYHLEALSLTQQDRQIVATLSKGQKQRVGILQALLHQPTVLLLDEPTQGLDTQQLEIFLSFLQEYKKKAAIIFSSHHLYEVESLCDSILQFNSQGMSVHDSHHCPA